MHRFPIFWQWLCHQGVQGAVKVPLEQYEEVTVGRGALVNWLAEDTVKDALVLQADPDPGTVAYVVQNGYGGLDQNGVELVGRDPFLVAYALRHLGERTVVTFEVSKPRRRGANRKIPDVCRDLGVPCCTLFDMINALDFTTGWQPESP